MLVCDFRSAFCTRDRGCSAHPAFPAPSSSRDTIRKPRASPAARMWTCIRCLTFESISASSLRVRSYRPRGRRRWTKQTPRSSPGLTGRSSIPETVVSNREAAAYSIARSSRATTVLLWQRSCKPWFQELGNVGHNAATIASSPSVSAAGPGCRISGDFISTMRS